MKTPFTIKRIKTHPIIAGKIKVYLVWFDSYGAKSSCTLIKTPDAEILIDPGAAAMQPSYPLPQKEKEKLAWQAHKTIAHFARSADTIIITHYHYDHYTLPSQAPALYRKKTLWIKNPNQWINHSQWKRARLFLTELYNYTGGKDTKAIFTEPATHNFKDPTFRLPIAMAKDYGDYQHRKNELLKKGRSWFINLASSLWAKELWISEFTNKDISVHFADGKKWEKNNTTVRFTEPLFHGIEYDRVGWVIGVTVQYHKHKILFTSDLQGPSIEDYARWIIEENPDIIIADGPATYLFGYIVNRINLNRAINNISRIIENTKTDPIIYDHHLTREPRFKGRIENAYAVAKKSNKNFSTAAEWLGERPVVLKYTFTPLKKSRAIIFHF